MGGSWKKISSCISNVLDFNSKIFFISEVKDWVIRDICENIIKRINYQYPKISKLSYSPLLLHKKIVHFGSVNTIVGQDGILNLGPSNRIILTWFHIIDGDARLKYITTLNEKINFVHTSCKITANKLIANGFDEKKVVLIPIGIDLDIFKPSSVSDKIENKKKLNLPIGKFIIGSFQKDGVGWGEGLEPKLEKGPDIFCDVVEKLSQNHDVHVLLTGPARGYVKRRLEKAGICYTHKYLKNYSEIVDYYNALDLYLITSREEGGPKAVLECMATGVPFVSTAVGMVPDIIKNGVNGMIAEVGNVDELVDKASQIYVNKSLRDSLVSQAIIDVKSYSWDNIAQKYYNLLYKKLL